MNGKKRNSRSYKCTDTVYRKAQRQSKRDKITVAKVVEDYLVRYGNGESPYWKSVPEIN